MRTLYINQDCPHEAIKQARVYYAHDDRILTAIPSHDNLRRPAYLVKSETSGKKLFVIVIQ
jgi:hypothetical protein